jgi:hypothetical protein
MALDLLTRRALEGKTQRRYRHDCESFVWVLLWICCRYENGKEIRNAPLGEFITLDYDQCFKEKHCILSELRRIEPTTSYQSFWDASVALVSEFVKIRLDKDCASLNGNFSFLEPTNDEVVRRCRKSLEGKGVIIFAEPKSSPGGSFSTAYHS